MTPLTQERRHGGRVHNEVDIVQRQLLAASKLSDLSTKVDVPSTASKRRSRRVWTAYGVLGALLVVYLVAVLSRNMNQQWAWLDGWSVCAFEVVASGLCIARGLARQTGRAAPLLLGFGLLSWAIGDFFLNVESIGGATPTTPSAADLFYLLFYPLAYIATVQLLQKALGRKARPNWLDGVVAGLGAAALCAAFAFGSIQMLTGGSALATATNLAYPIGDLLLLSLVIGGTVLLSGRGTRPWYFLAGGLTVIVFGDTFNLVHTSKLATQFGSDFNAIAWPTAILLISMSVWLPSRHLDPLEPEKTAGFSLPGIAAASSLVILVVGTQNGVSNVSIGLSIATLLTVGARLAISAHRLRVLTEERHRQAHTDELTGLGNRRQLTHVLDTFFADQADDPDAVRDLAFLFVDLNHFKEINDSFGHPAGDELLRQIGPRLVRAVGSSGSVVRLGGDELAVVLMDADAHDAEAVAQRIQGEIKEPFELEKISATVGASIGIAMVPANATNGTNLLWCADVAMYRAKLSQLEYVFFDESLDGGVDQPKLLDELRAAIDQGNFVLHYQPQLDLRTSEILAVEALIRWPHPTLGLVPPLQFLPLAEEAGLMRPLTAWVLDEAIGQCAQWRVDGTELAVSVNISTSNLLENGFVELVEELLARHDLPAYDLVIEITETTIINDFAKSQRVIQRLRDMGIVVSIDDFGAGFTSLAYLSSLAVGELKLDRAFIVGLANQGDGRDLELVRATINLGHEMGLRVVAEGIEDLETLDLLSDLGCDLAQGYYISRPTPADKLSFTSMARSPELVAATVD
jgi:diguanylate cyclase (GGDEF)-like protein